MGCFGYSEPKVSTVFLSSLRQDTNKYAECLGNRERNELITMVLVSLSALILVFSAKHRVAAIGTY